MGCTLASKYTKKRTKANSFGSKYDIVQLGWLVDSVSGSSFTQKKGMAKNEVASNVTEDNYKVRAEAGELLPIKVGHPVQIEIKSTREDGTKLPKIFHDIVRDGDGYHALYSTPKMNLVRDIRITADGRVSTNQNSGEKFNVADLEYTLKGVDQLKRNVAKMFAPQKNLLDMMEEKLNQETGSTMSAGMDELVKQLNDGTRVMNKREELLGATIERLMEDDLKSGVYSGAYDTDTKEISVLFNGVPPGSVKMAMRKEFLSAVDSEYTEAAQDGRKVKNVKEDVIAEADRIADEINAAAQGIKGSVAHEFVHRATQYALDNNKDNAGVKRLNELWEMVSTSSKIDLTKYMPESAIKVGVKEFVAYGMTNPHMIKMLDEIKLIGKGRVTSMLKEFIAAVSKALNLGSENSVFREMVWSVEHIANSVSVDTVGRGAEYGAAYGRWVNKSTNKQKAFETAMREMSSSLGIAEIEYANGSGAEIKALAKTIDGFDKMLEEYMQDSGYMLNQETDTGTGGRDMELWDKMKEKLQKLYPEIKLTESTDEIGERIKGQADIEAGTVLINTAIATTDTLPHEYAHHYIRWFKDAPIVKEAIKKWGSEEALVQAIGEQAVKQKGEVYGWWKKFSKWVKSLFKELPNRDKEDLKNLLTDALLKRKDLINLDNGSNSILKQPKIRGNTFQSSELRERIEQHAFDISPELEKIGSKAEYDKYMKTIFPDSMVQDLYTHTTYGYDEKAVFEELSSRSIKDVIDWSKTEVSKISKKEKEEVYEKMERFVNNGSESIFTKKKNVIYLLPDKVRERVEADKKELLRLKHIHNQKIADNGEIFSISFGKESTFSGSLSGKGDKRAVNGFGHYFYMPRNKNGGSIDNVNSIRYPGLEGDIIVPVKLNLKKVISFNGTKKNIRNTNKYAGFEGNSKLEKLFEDNGIDGTSDPKYRLGKVQQDADSKSTYNALLFANDKYSFNGLLSYDSINPEKSSMEAVMVDNADIHILGSDKDIEMFKEWKIKMKDVKSEKISKLNPQQKEVLGASKEDVETGIQDEDFMQVEGDILHNKEGMLQFANELSLGDDISAEEREELLSTLESLLVSEGKFIPKELEVYVKEQEDADTAVVFSPEGQRPGVYVTNGKMVDKESLYSGKLEKLVHDIGHAAMFYAMESKHPYIMELNDQMNELHEHVAEKMHWTDLLGAEYTDREKVAAQDMVKYIQEGGHAVHEFASLARTNKHFKKAIEGYETPKTKKQYSNGLLGQIVKIFDDIVNFFVGIATRKIKGDNVLEVANSLMTNLQKFNNEAEIEIKRNKVSQKIKESFDKMNKELAKLLTGTKGIHEKVASVLGVRGLDASAAAKKILAEGSTLKKLGYLLFYAPPLIFSDDDLKRGMGVLMTEVFSNRMGLKFLGPNGTLRTLARYMRKNDSITDTVEQLGLANQKIDAEIFDYEVETTQAINTLFNDKLTLDEKELLTESLFETDIQALLQQGYELEDVYDDNIRAEIIADLESKIRKKEKGKFGTYYVNQARQLGRHMATGKGGETTMRNAYAIATLAGTGAKGVEFDPGVVELIDALASAQAVNFTEKRVIAETRRLMEEHSEAIHLVIEKHRGFVAGSTELLFNGEGDLNIEKGYISSILNEDIDVKVVPIKHRDMMERKGYKLLGSPYMNSAAGGVYKHEVGMFVNEFGGIGSYKKQAIRTLNTQRKGTTINEMMTIMDEMNGKDPDYKMNRKKSKAVEKQMKQYALEQFDKLFNEDDAKVPDGMIPTLDAHGNVQTYRSMMSKKVKKEVYTQDKRLGVVLGQMQGRMYNKIVTSDMNRKALDVMFDDYTSHHTITGYEDRLYTYKEIGPEVEDEELRTMWFLIPKEDRDYLTEKIIKRGAVNKKLAEGEKIDEFNVTMPIREDLLYLYMGSRNVSATEMFDVKSLRYIADKNRNGVIMLKKIVRLAEKLWSMVVRQNAVNIVIKTPAVWIGNITANFIQAVRYGYSLVRVFAFYVKGAVAFFKYRSIKKGSVRLRMEIQKEEAAGRSARAQRLKLQRLGARMEKHGANPLFKAGLFSTIKSEELGKDDVKINTKLDRAMLEWEAKIPEAVKKPAKLAVLAEDTAPYKVMLAITQMGDFIHRFALYHLEMLRAKEEYKKDHGVEMPPDVFNVVEEKIIIKIRDAAVNYNKWNPKAMEYLENVLGEIKFQRFAVGTQKTLTEEVENRPMNMLASILLQEAFIDFEDSSDHNVLALAGNLGKFNHSLGETLDTATNLSGVLALQNMDKAFSGVTH